MDVATLFVCAPMAVMLLTAIVVSLRLRPVAEQWQCWQDAASVAMLFTLVSAGLVMLASADTWRGFNALGLHVSPLQAVIAILVQTLGWVVGRFSRTYLEGEPQQRQYIVSLSMVLTCVHLLLIADHWLSLILAWSGIGIFLKNMLCFYQARPFALLASHKKSVADMVADALLLAAAGLSWLTVGSDSISALLSHVSVHGHSVLTEGCAVLLVAAVVLRTALLPVHGWLIQVMEAPTPVSALLHAGVVNLSGYLLIRFAPLFAQDTLANALLLGIGVLTCVFAALVMFTRISIKVRLAWSTVAQMGFMIVECALGLYTFAALHLIGHSIYKAYAFLSAAEVVSHTRRAHISGPTVFSRWSFVWAPVISFSLVWGTHALFAHGLGAPLWPQWWSVILALAWAPVLWWRAASADPSANTGASRGLGVLFGLLLTIVLTALSAGFHWLPLGVVDQPHQPFAAEVVVAMALLYLFSVLIQVMPQRLHVLHRWIYAGLYLDAFYTRCILRMWPVSWGKKSHGYL